MTHSKNRIIPLFVLIILPIFLYLNSGQNVQEITENHSLDNFVQKPRVKAFLDVIAFAEGTLHDDGYKTLYGGGLFHDFSDHPRLVIKRKHKSRKLNSSAAGRYQILAKSWDRIARKFDIKDFSPVNQDRAALALIKQSGALKYVVSGDFENAIKRVKYLWASLPGSNYKQPIVNLAKLKKIYKQRLNLYQC